MTIYRVPKFCAAEVWICLHMAAACTLLTTDSMPTVAANRPILAPPAPSDSPPPIEIAARQCVNYRDPRSVDLAIALHRAAIVASPTPKEKWSARFGLFCALRLAHRNLDEQNTLSRLLIAEANWNSDETVEAALSILDLHIFDLAKSPLRDLKFAAEVALLTIGKCRDREQFAFRMEAEIKLLRIRRETEGTQTAIVRWKLLCLEASAEISDGALDMKRTPSPRQRLSNGTSIDNVGLIVSSLVVHLGDEEREATLRELEIFCLECELEDRIASAVRTGLNDCRNDRS